MNVLVLGKGGREHALCTLLKKSKTVTTLYVLNANPGMSAIAKNLVGSETFDHILLLCKQHNIDVVIPGGEADLAAGITDYLTPHGITVFGPNKQAAKIEASKAFAKELMKKYKIPTAAYETFDSYSPALNYLTAKNPPYVIKYDGLALGKGVFIRNSLEEAKLVLDRIFVKEEYATSKVVIEDFLVGKEYSFIVMVHNSKIVPLPIAKDYKRIFDNDQGPNTGGMGAFSPVPFVDTKVYNASKTIMEKTVEAMRLENINYTGFLYGGFILTSDGPKIIEFNCRLGDPEAEVILPRIQNDFFEAIMKLLNNQEVILTIDDHTHLGVVLAANGYPETYQKNIPIEKCMLKTEQVFHMGTTLIDNKLLSSGGRVLFVHSSGTTLIDAKEKVYEIVKRISINELTYRNDIGTF